VKPETRSAIIGAAVFLVIFGVLGFFMPGILISAAETSPWLAVLIAAIFIGAFFVVFWLRGRYQERRKD
jgi:cytochrome bd-type quinol oxidase subunit 2